MAQLWDAATGQPVGEPLRHDSGVVQVIFSPDGRFLSTTTLNSTAAVWDVATGHRLFEAAHTANLTPVAFTPDSQRLLTVDGSKVRIWNWDSDKFTPATYSLLMPSAILIASFSSDGHTILAAGTDGEAWVWDAVSAQRLFQSTIQHDGPITSSCFSPDGQRFATAGNDAVIRLWSTTTGQPVSPPLKFILIASRAAFNSDGRRLLGKSCDQAARIWDMATSDLPGPRKPILENEQRLISPDGRKALRLGESNAVWIADAGSGSRLAALPHVDDLTYASFSRDGQTIITASEEQNEVSSMRNEIFLWDSASGRRLNNNEMSHKFLLLYTAFSPDNHRLLTCSLDFTARLWADRSASKPIPTASRTGHLGSIQPGQPERRNGKLGQDGPRLGCDYGNGTHAALAPQGARGGSLLEHGWQTSDDVDPGRRSAGLGTLDWRAAHAAAESR
jgi:WD40 repeat protein